MDDWRNQSRWMSYAKVGDYVGSPIREIDDETKDRFKAFGALRLEDAGDQYLSICYKDNTPREKLKEIADLFHHVSNEGSDKDCEELMDFLNNN